MDINIPKLTALEAYNWVQLNLNKLSNNNNQNLPKYQMVAFFNTALMRWFETRIKYKETHTTVIDELQQFVETKEITLTGSNPATGDLPDNYAHYARLVSSYSECGTSVNSLFVRESDLTRFLQDANTKPSFDWGENLATVRGNKLSVYSDVPIKKVTLVYYRFPKSMNLEDGFTDLADNLTANVDPEIIGSNLYEVLTLTVRDLAAAIGDGNKTQFSASLNQLHT